MRSVVMVFFLIINTLQMSGRFVITTMVAIGETLVFLFITLSRAATPPYFPRQYLRQFIEIAWMSIPVIGTTCLFAGMVLTLQSYAGFARFSAENAISRVVALSITRELAPVLCGLLVAGRSGSAIAAEISTMKLNDQVDALKVMLVDPLRFLVAPRVIALVIFVPVLVLLGDIIGIMGSYGLAVLLLGFDGPSYLSATWDALSIQDVSSGVIKAVFFGLLIALMGCMQGLNARRDAKGVGMATTSAVIYGSMLILISNFFITAILF